MAGLHLENIWEGGVRQGNSQCSAGDVLKDIQGGGCRKHLEGEKKHWGDEKIFTGVSLKKGILQGGPGKNKNAARD